MMKKLNELEIKKLSTEVESVGERVFSRGAVLFYEGHIPHACYLLLSGEVQLLKKNKLEMKVKPGHIVGFSDFDQQNCSKYSAVITAGSRVFIIDRSTFLELKESSDFDLQQIIS